MVSVLCMLFTDNISLLNEICKHFDLENPFRYNWSFSELCSWFETYLNTMLQKISECEVKVHISILNEVNFGKI